MARVPDNYIPVKARILKLKAEHKDSRVLTETVTARDDYIIVKASICLEEVVVAQGQALVAVEEADEKGFEKAETVAIGRALTNFGYEDKGEEEETEEEEKPRNSGRNRLKSKSSTKKKSKLKQVDEEEVEAEAEEEEDLGVPADEEDEDEDTEESSEEETEEEEEEAPAKSAKVSKLKTRKSSSGSSGKKASAQDILNKYRKRG